MRPSEYIQSNPVRLDISRSRFYMDPRWTGSFNSWELVPIFNYGDVLPGDTFKFDVSMAIRMSTPAVPVMDDLWLDVAFYFVPYRLVLSRAYMSPSVNDSNSSWTAFVGAQDSLLNMPVPDSGITLPVLGLAKESSTPQRIGGIADCMGYPVNPTNNTVEVNALHFLSFMAVWNENYRDPNSQNPGVFRISSNSVMVKWSAAGLNSDTNSINDAHLPNVCRFHSYFGSCLPWPQRNSVGVQIPLANVPVVTGQQFNPFDFGSTEPLVMKSLDTTTFGPLGARPLWAYNQSGSSSAYGKTWLGSNASQSSTPTGMASPANLWADLSRAGFYVNVLRQSVQQQRWYEALARSGNNGLDVITAGMFGVVPKDAGMNRVEYLGGKRIPIVVAQVNSTAETTTGKVGDTGAFSLTNDSDYYFTKSFDTWGCIVGVACVRNRDSFSQGLDRQFTRSERFDYYWTQFANLGEQAVLNKEICLGSDASKNEKVFGYQEAWSEYRTMPDHVCGLVKPGRNLAHWTYANYFLNSLPSAEAPSLSDFIQGTGAKENIDRTLLVSHSTSGYQFVGQFQFGITAVRPLPTYSIPGLVDHH